MSTPEFEMLVSEALKLTPAERTALMHELLISLPAPECAQVGDLRDEDLVRRINLVKSGQATLLDRDEFDKRMRDKIS